MLVKGRIVGKVSLPGGMKTYGPFPNDRDLPTLRSQIAAKATEDFGVTVDPADIFIIKEG